MSRNADHDRPAGMRGPLSRGAAADRFERTIRAGGVVLFPSDTVYGLACDPHDTEAIKRLYALKGRPPDKAAAVMFFDRDAAFAAIGDCGPRTHMALTRLMPGGITALLPNPGRLYPLACRSDPETLGLRVIDVPDLRGVDTAVLQSSANPSGGSDACRLADVAPAMRAGAALVIDGGELPGRSSTVVDLRRYESDGVWSIVRQGAVEEERVGAVLKGAQMGFDPDTYARMIREDVPGYEAFQEQVVAACRATGVGRILELGTGTGETARRVLAEHPNATMVGVDASAEMLSAAAGVLDPARVQLRTGWLEDLLPQGPFDLVFSALAVHHLDGLHKAGLFTRVRAVLARGGRFVLGDMVVPEEPSEVSIAGSDGFDVPSSVAEIERWLEQAGFESVALAWARRDLAVIVAH